MKLVSLKAMRSSGVVRKSYLNPRWVGRSVWQWWAGSCVVARVLVKSDRSIALQVALTRDVGKVLSHSFATWTWRERTEGKLRSGISIGFRGLRTLQESSSVFMPYLRFSSTTILTSLTVNKLWVKKKFINKLYECTQHFTDRIQRPWENQIIKCSLMKLELQANQQLRSSSSKSFHLSSFFKL